MTEKQRVGFVTAGDLSRYMPSKKNPLYTHDDQAAVDDLTAHGWEVAPVVWGTPPEQLRRGGFALLVVRSPWDYMDSDLTRTSFLAWITLLAAAGLTVVNDITLMLWSLDKHYLGDLAEVGATVVPTVFLGPDQPCNLAEWVAERGPLVVKPAIAAAAKDAHRIMTPAAAANLDFAALRSGRTFLIQPYLPEIVSTGEWSLVMIDGVFSHAVWKRPALGNWLVQDELGGSVESAVPPDSVLAAAEHTWSLLPAAFGLRERARYVAPLYGRIDVILTAKGPLTSELELVEPELFFLKRAATGNQPDHEALRRFREGLLRYV